MKKTITLSIVALVAIVAGMGLYNHLHKPVETLIIIQPVDLPSNVVQVKVSSGTMAQIKPIKVLHHNLPVKRAVGDHGITESLNRQSLLAMRLKMADTPTCTPGEGDPEAGPGYLCGTWRKVNDGPWEYMK
jgi:hypothetical protein